MKLRKILKILLFIIIIQLILSPVFNIYLSGSRAFKSLEKDSNYGPSKIIFKREFENSLVYIGSYKDSFSSMEIKKFGPFFRPTRYSYGYYKDPTKDFNFVLGHTDSSRIFGSINNPKIEYLLLDFNRGPGERISDFKENMFLYSWKTSESKQPRRISAYDKEGKEVYGLDI